MPLVRRSEKRYEAHGWVGDQERLERLVRVLEGSEVGEVTATATEAGGHTLRGDPAEVFDLMDRKALTKLELRVGDRYEDGSIDVVLDKVAGTRVDTRGETAWVEANHGAVVVELERARPWWWWLRSIPVSAGATAIVYVTIMIAGAVGRVPTVDIADALLLVLTGTWGVSAAGSWAIRRLLPGFEVTLPGGRGRGGTAIAIAGTILLTVAGAILPALMS